MNAKEYRELREMLGLSQAALASALGVTNKTISNRERGTKPIAKEAELAMRELFSQMNMRMSLDLYLANTEVSQY